jgi:glycerol-3-phosphate dehydrogenase (NAD(P)+)
MAEKRMAILGNGSWATALVQVVATNGYKVHWWVREAADIETIRREGRNPSYLAQARIPMQTVTVHADPAEAIRNADICLFVIPAAFLHNSIQHLPKDLFRGKIVASAIKGLDVHTGKIINDYFKDKFGIAASHYAVISGPSHAEEVVLGRTTFLTVGSASEVIAAQVGGLLQSDNLHVIISTDVRGLEYAAVLKNIYAVATGLAVGLGLGDNFVAVLVSACLKEMDHFLPAPPGAERHIADSAYLGDLLVTAFSEHSRNRTLGTLVGQGLTPAEAKEKMKMVAEGYYASRLMVENNNTDNLPIARGVYDVLHNGASPRDLFDELKLAFR